MNKQVLVGLDAGSAQHTLQAVKRREGQREGTPLNLRIPNSHVGCDQLVKYVRGWLGEGYEVWVAAEGKGGWLSPVDVRLAALGCKWINIHSLQFQRFREICQVQPDKDDEIDAGVLLEILQWLMDHHQERVYEVANPYYRNLQNTAHSFVLITGGKVAAENQLMNLVRQYWPELVHDFFSRTDSPCLIALLVHYPTPQMVAKAGWKKISALFKKACGRAYSHKAQQVVENACYVQQRLQVSDNQTQLIQTLATHLEGEVKTIKDLEKQLKQSLQKHPFGRWLLGQKGIGVRTAGCFLGEAGDLSRFQCEEQLARFAGFGGNRSQSGQSKGHHFDGRRYNHGLKRVVMLIARSRHKNHPPSQLFVAQRQKEPRDFWPILKKLARHILRFLWKGWQETVKFYPSNNLIIQAQK
jgi:hypothetical protein